MKQTITLLFLLFFCLNSFTQVKRTVHVETAGTLSTLIEASAKYEITDLTLTGKLNGYDVAYLREMAGGYEKAPTEGKLEHLNMEEGVIVKGGSYQVYSGTYSTENMEVGERMFAYLEKIKTISIPKSTKVIKRSAFFSCTGLESFTFPDNTFLLEHQAFEKCSSLQRVYIGKGLDFSGSLKFGNFNYCPQLERFDVSEENPYLKSADGVLYSKDGSKLYRYPNARGPVYEIPEGVELDRGAFQGCADLESVVISEGIEALDWEVFNDCSGLKSVKLPESLLTMKGDVFRRCSSLTSIILPSKLTYIGAAFCGCIGIREIYSKNPTPPEANFSCDFDQENCKVYVPVGSSSAYSKAEGWRNFFHIIETDFSGIADVSTDPELKVYPNPASDVIRIEGEGIVECILFDFSGKTVLKSATPEVNVSFLPSGIYHLLIKTVRGDFYKKMIKQ